MWRVASPQLTEPAMMNGYLQCACSASFQDLQLLLQEQQGRKPSLLRTAHLLTVTDDPTPAPRRRPVDAMGSLQMAASQDKQALSGHGEEKEKGHPTILLPIDGAPMCTLTQTLTSPLL